MEKERKVLVKDLDTEVGSFTIGKGISVYTLPAGLTATCGQTLKDIDLPEVSGSDTPGVWSWQMLDAVVGTVDVTVTVNSASGHIVSFESNGGSAVASQEITEGGTVRKPAEPMATLFTLPSVIQRIRPTA